VVDVGGRVVGTIYQCIALIVEDVRDRSSFALVLSRHEAIR